MILLGGLVGAGLAFLFARGLVFYHAFFSMSRAAYTIAGIEAIPSGALARCREWAWIVVSAPLVGLTVLSPESARETMQQAMENTAARFSSRDNARTFLRIAHELVDRELPPAG
jgi:hypothetical protein